MRRLFVVVTSLLLAHATAAQVTTPATPSGSNNANGANQFAGMINGAYNVAACGSASAPSWCSGSDLGAWINAAIAAMPTQTMGVANKRTSYGGSYNYHYGTIVIPPSLGIIRYTTTIGNASTCPATITTCLPITFVRFECGYGTQLDYAGSGKYWVNALDPFGVADGLLKPGGFNDCTFYTPGSPAKPPDNQTIFIGGNYTSYDLTNDTFMNLNGSGDIAVDVENSVYFSERWNFHGTRFLYNTDAVVFDKKCGDGGMDARACTNSFEHSELSYYCGTGFAHVTSCLKALHGAALQYEDFHIRFNLNGASTSSVIYCDSASTIIQNSGIVTGENDVPSGSGNLTNQGLGPAPPKIDSVGINFFCAGCTDTAGSPH
jgi:hypothetical protein